MTVYVWKPGTTGDWGLAANWIATPSGFPDDSAATVTIGAAGTYTVTIAGGESFTANTVTLSSSGADLAVTGTLTLAGTAPALTVTLGKFDLYGELIGGTVKAAGGTVVIENGATLDGVTYQGELDISASTSLVFMNGVTVESAAGTPPGKIVFASGSSLDVTGGLTMGAPGTPGSIQIAGSFDHIIFHDSETLDDAAVTISGFDDYINAFVYTLTLGADTTVDLSGPDEALYGSITNLGSIGLTSGFAYLANGAAAVSTFDNQGSLSVHNGTLFAQSSTFSNEGSIDLGAGLLDISGAAFTNSGMVTVESGGTLELASPLTNTGTITVEAGGTLDVQDYLTLSELEGGGITIDPGATLQMNGTLDLQGGTLDVTATGPFSNVLLTSGGTIANGTIRPDDGGTFTLEGGAFDNVTYRGEFDIPDNTSVAFADGVTVESTAGTLPGAIVFGNSSTLDVTGALTVGAPGTPGSILLANLSDGLIFYDSETLDDAAVTVSGNEGIIESNTYTLTLGAGTTVDLSGNDDELYDSITNLGSIAVTGGLTYASNRYAASTFDNQGSISVVGGILDVENETVDNAGRVTIGNGGVLEIGANVSVTNTGTLTVESGGTLDLQDDVTLSAFTGVTVESGGLLQIMGTFDLQSSGTMDVAASGPFNNVLLSGGVIENGAIKADGGTLGYSGNATFSDVVYQGELDLVGDATLSAENGLTVQSAIGAAPGTIAIGAVFSLSVTGGLTVGTATNAGSILLDGRANLTFNDTETLSHAAVIVTGDNDSVYATTLTFDTDTTVSLGGTSTEIDGNFVNLGSIGATGTATIYGATTFDNRGSLTVDGGNLSVENTNFSNEGRVTVDNGGFLYASTTTFTSTDAVHIGSGGTLEIAPASAVDVHYDDPALLILDDPSGYTGTLSGIGVGDALQLDGQDVTHAGISGGVLTAELQGGGSLTLNADPALNGTQFSISTGSDGDQDLLTAEAIACFLPGTLIRTTRGDVAVEQLAVGDTVVTLSGRQRRLCWIGKGSALATRGRRTAATPVIVRKGALADNVPHRDLRITKGHSLFLDDVLIPVEFLVNHRSIHWDDVTREVEVYHLELDGHDILIANGAASESYRDDGNRWLFRNANAGWHQPAKPACAPVLTGGPVVDAVWRRLLDRAGPRPVLPMTDDPDLHLLVDGRRVEAVSGGGAWRVFRLAGPPATARIVSRAGAPQELGLARDPRALGVAVRGIMVTQGKRVRTIEAEDALLADGFHGFEPDEAIRWTDGDAAIPACLFDGFAGPLELALRLGGTTSYMAEGEVLRAA